MRQEGAKGQKAEPSALRRSPANKSEPAAFPFVSHFYIYPSGDEKSIDYDFQED
ncbi:MAG: hypothetical protein LBT22_08875 [Peptococcaceae bacterium]|nr:hypothetical protein [Peptococcaceae bacterium]